MMMIMLLFKGINCCPFNFSSVAVVVVVMAVRSILVGDFYVSCFDYYNANAAICRLAALHSVASACG